MKGVFIAIEREKYGLPIMHGAVATEIRSVAQDITSQTGEYATNHYKYSDPWGTNYFYYIEKLTAREMREIRSLYGYSQDLKLVAFIEDDAVVARTEEGITVHNPASKNRIGLGEGLPVTQEKYKKGKVINIE